MNATQVPTLALTRQVVGEAFIQFITIIRIISACAVKPASESRIGKKLFLCIVSSSQKNIKKIKIYKTSTRLNKTNEMY